MSHPKASDERDAAAAKPALSPMHKLRSISDEHRSRLSEAWVAFATTVRREVHRVVRIWPQTLLPPVITTVLYFIIFGPILGSRIGDMESVPLAMDDQNIASAERTDQRIDP